MQTMRAKFVIDKIEDMTSMFTLHMRAVTDAPYNPDGESEDNSFARWTPTGSLTMSVTNPALFGKFKQGQKLYLDFTPAPDAVAGQ